MRRHRADSNQQTIVKTLRAVGASVHPICSAGGTREGLPDLLVGWQRRTLLLEVKAAGGRLRETQREWAETWRGSPPVTVWTPGDALRALGLEGGD